MAVAAGVATGTDRVSILAPWADCERICEIRNSQIKKWDACWEGDVQVREVPFDGALVEELTKAAIRHLQDDNLDMADRFCEKAEYAMVGDLDKADRFRECTPRPRRRRKAARK